MFQLSTEMRSYTQVKEDTQLTWVSHWCMGELVSHVSRKCACGFDVVT
ncbi:hypothetical protein HanRHA438_Chr16g0769541 [Helianthus annuus]|nr:hypothetical protein HanRHA438_Chr16g0769541 [Helianthus annuus]